MVQKNFGIYGEDDAATRLYVEIGDSIIACWSITDNNDWLHSFELFEFGKDMSDYEEIFRQTKLYSKLLSQSYPDVKIILNNKDVVAVPGSFYREDSLNDYFLLETGAPAHGKVMKDIVPDYIVAYCIPETILAAAERAFPKVSFSHKKTLLYNTDTQEYPKDALLQVAFYRNNCSVVVYQQHAISLVQNFCYQTSEDVLYFLLNCMKQLNIENSDATVQVSGLIDKNSAMYGELYKYIANLETDDLSADKLDKAVFEDYPLHYFSPFYKMVV
ncbi:DUF3822 family protein [Danxiaibacter flavus]|uniref:DUF3822 family protein n=1 Tax=Danxiaibacter flavus TaxID=3049108 RepID=A0ABV3ZAJ9_9BACT|nr:DUF3822 family protein [Chitinophagaceae bacterium DXS]